MRSEGKKEIIHGDCLQIMKQLESKSIDMILCDLPYGTTRCKWDVIIPFDKLWEQYDRILKDNGVVVLFGSEPFSSMVRISNLKKYKSELGKLISFDQFCGAVQNGQQFYRDFEPVSKQTRLEL